MLDAHLHCCLSSSAEGWVNQEKPPWQPLPGAGNSLHFAGLHPWFITENDSLDSVFSELKAFLDNNKRSGIGECGLDVYSEVSLSLQEEVLLRQLSLAGSTARPVSIHCVKAWDRLIHHLKCFSPDFPVMIHSFHSSLPVAESLLDLGCYLSFSPGQLLLANSRIEAVFKKLPSDRILLETDAPHSRYFRIKGGLTVELYDKTLRLLYSKAAELRHIDTEEMMGIIGRNGQVFKDRAFNRNR